MSREQDGEHLVSAGKALPGVDMLVSKGCMINFSSGSFNLHVSCGHI